MMTAEGQAYNLDRTIDTSDLFGTISGTIAWRDGTNSAATIQSAPTIGPIKFRFDYSLDTAGFFSDASRRAILQTVADLVSSKFSDNLSAIQPQSGDTWDAVFLDPSSGIKTTRTNPRLAANEVLVFVGSRNLGSAEGGIADRGGFTAQSSRQAFLDSVKARGQSGALLTPATDVGPWGGSISFDSSRSWYFGTSPDGLQTTQLDFASVAAHELMHILGFGTTSVWDTKISNSRFVGTNAVAVYGSGVPLADADHFTNNLTIDGRRPAMVQIFNTGERLLPSRLDLAGLQDIGWQLIPQTVRVTGAHTYGDNADLNIQIALVGSGLGSKAIQLPITIANTNPVLSPISNQSATVGTQLTLAGIGQFTDSGYGMALATPPQFETFTYRIRWGDGSADDHGAATISSVGSPGQSTKGFFDGAHTFQNAGTYTVGVRVMDDDLGFAEREFQVVVAQIGKVTLSVDKKTISEDAGAGAAVLTVTRTGGNLSSPLVVNLTSSDTSEATVVASVTIPANQTSTTASITAVDDSLFDGTQLVNLTPNVTGYELVGTSIDVTDYQPLVLTALRDELDEGVAESFSTQVTVSIRSAAPAGGISVQIAATPSGYLSFPGTIVIPAGSSQASFTVSVINDDRPSNPRSIVLQGTGNGVIPGQMTFLVRDNDPARWTNPSNAFDVDNSGDLNPLDVLVVIDEINRRGARILDPVQDGGLPFVDPNRDGALDPLDVLILIDQINRG